MRNTKVGLIVGAMAALVATACSKSEQKQPTGEPTKEAPQAAQEAPKKEEDVIKLGQTMPYSGPASAYGTIGRVQAAFFKKLNSQGGIDGKKVEIISMDDSYSPPRAVEQVRRLVETDHVTAIFNGVGTPSNTAIRPYLNEKKVAQLFVATGASKWADPQHFPYTIGFNPSYRVEGRTYAEHILKTKPKAKIAVLYQGDDFGKDIFEGVKEGLGENKKMIVAEATYETSDPTIDSQIVSLKASKADTVILITTPKFGAQAVRKVAELNWDATRYIVNVSSSIGSVLVPAGLERAKGLITTQYLKDPNDKRWADDPAMKEYLTFLKNDFPEGDLRDTSNLYGYVAAQTLVQVLKQCKGDYSAKNLMAQAASLKNFAPGVLLPGLEINTSPTDFELFDKMQLASFDGESWKLLESNGVAAK